MDPNRLDISIGQFAYTFTFVPANNILVIDCMHRQDYYCWSTVISEDILNLNGTNLLTKHKLHVTLYPDELYQLINTYVTNKLRSIYTFRFPAAYQTPEIPLVIEFIADLPTLLDSKITKSINLQPVSITDVKCFNFQLKCLQQKIDEKIQQMQMTIQQVQQIQMEMKQILQIFETRSQK